MMITTIPRESRKDNKVENDVKGKVIRKAQIARQLVRKGGKIIDLKGDKFDPDGKRSVFIFEDSDDFQKIFSEVIDENRRERNGDDQLRKDFEELKKRFDELSKMSATVNSDIAKE